MIEILKNIIYELYDHEKIHHAKTWKPHCPPSTSTYLPFFPPAATARNSLITGISKVLNRTFVAPRCNSWERWALGILAERNMFGGTVEWSFLFWCVQSTDIVEGWQELERVAGYRWRVVLQHGPVFYVCLKYVCLCATLAFMVLTISNVVCLISCDSAERFPIGEDYPAHKWWWRLMTQWNQWCVADFLDSRLTLDMLGDEVHSSEVTCVFGLVMEHIWLPSLFTTKDLPLNTLFAIMQFLCTSVCIPWLRKRPVPLRTVLSFARSAFWATYDYLFAFGTSFRAILLRIPS